MYELLRIHTAPDGVTYALVWNRDTNKAETWTAVSWQMYEWSSN